MLTVLRKILDHSKVILVRILGHRNIARNRFSLIRTGKEFRICYTLEGIRNIVMSYEKLNLAGNRKVDASKVPECRLQS